MGNRLAIHLNSPTPEAKHTVEQTDCDLLCLNTAVDVPLVHDWRARNPQRRLVYREVFDGGNDRDVQGRCDRLSRNAEPLQPFGPVVALTPWNEERQARDLLPAYADDSCRATEILRSRGFLVAAGGYSVQWPRPEDRHLFLPAIQAADFFHFHTYGAPSIFDDYARNVGHGVDLAEWVWRETGKPSLITEFGIDWGVLGYRLTGWRGGDGIPGISAEDYAGQLRRAAMTFPKCIQSIFVYGFGGAAPGYGWGSFDSAGEWAIESLLRESYAMPEFVLGFKTFAETMRARGLDPGEPTEYEQPRVFEDGWVLTRQRTTRGTMLWLRDFNDMQFWGQDGRVVAYRGGNLGVA